MDAEKLMVLIRGALEDIDVTTSTEILTGDIKHSVADSAVMEILIEGVEYKITIAATGRQI